MKKIETILKKENYNFKVNEQISDGETSQIFLGEFNNIKSIFKLSKKNKFILIINEYFKNGIIQKIVTKNKLTFPAFVFFFISIIVLFWMIGIV